MLGQDGEQTNRRCLIISMGALRGVQPRDVARA